MLDLPERVWRRIIFNPNNQCWEWTGATTQGYAYCIIDKQRIRLARYINQTPDDLVTDHLCRNRKCLNPAHLESVTSAENTRRGESGFHFSGRTHCDNGHELAGDNLRVRNNGNGRECLTCKKERDRQRYLRKRAERRQDGQSSKVGRIDRRPKSYASTKNTEKECYKWTNK